MNFTVNTNLQWILPVKYDIIFKPFDSRVWSCFICSMCYWRTITSYIICIL